MSMDPGNSDCTTGLSKALYDALLGDVRLPWPVGMTEAQKDSPRAIAYAIASKVAAEANADNLTVHAAYTSVSGQVIPSGVATVVNFATKQEDTHNAVITGVNWRFLAPTGRGGRYLVTAACTFATGVTDGVSILAVRVSDVERYRLARIAASVTEMQSVGGSAVVTLTDGQHLDVVVSHQSDAGGEALETVASANYVTVTRLGD